MTEAQVREMQQKLLTTRGALRQAQKQIDVALKALDASLPAECNKFVTNSSAKSEQDLTKV